MVITLAVVGTTLTFLLLAVMARHEVRRAQDAVRAARLELAHAQQRAADEEAGKYSALQLLDEQRVLRLKEYEEFGVRLEALHTVYDRTLRQYREALVRDAAVPSQLN